MPADQLNAYSSPSTARVWDVSNADGTLGGTPSNWESPSFNDGGWAAALECGSIDYFFGTDLNDNLGPPVAPSQYICTPDAPTGTYDRGLTWLVRISFFLPSLPTVAEFYYDGDNAVTPKINGVEPTTPSSLPTINVDPFVVGWNVLTLEVANGLEPIGWSVGNPTWTTARLYTDVANGTAPEPPPPPPSLDFEICGPDGTNCVLIERATAKKIRVEYNGTGSGAFQISRYDSQATNDILSPGNIVRVTFTEIDPNPIYEFILETGDFTLISSDEEGGEMLAFGGRGTLALLAYTRLGHQWLDTTHPKLNFPTEGVWRWDGEEAAGILRRIIDESKLHTPPALSDVVHGGTVPWSDTHDSLGNPFYDMNGKWEIPIGQDLLTAAMALARAGMMQLEMRPGFSLWAYDEQGADRTGDFGADTVRFEKGVNIGGFDSTELVRQINNETYTSNVLIHTKDGYLWYNAGLTTPDYVKESFLDLSGTDSTNDQERAAARAMLLGAMAQEGILFEVTPTGPNGEKNEPELGFYFPGFEGTANGKYWIGDLVTLHTGEDPDLDFQDATARVHAISLYEDETGAVAPPIVELNSSYNLEDSAGGTPTGSSNSEGGGSGGGGGATNTPHVHTQYQVLADKGQVDGYAELDAGGLVPSAQLGTGGVGGGAKFLADDQTFQTPPTVGTLDDLTDVTITAAAEGDMLRYESGAWVNTQGRYEPVVADPGTGPEVLFDGTSGDILMHWVE